MNKKKLLTLLLAAAMLLVLLPAAVVPAGALEESLSTGATLISATHYQSSADKFASVWNPSNTTQQSVQNTGICDYSSAMLAGPTVIDKVVLDYGAQGSRARNGLIYGSVDGETWEVIGKIPGTNSNNTTMTASISTNKAYSYVKVEQAESLKQYWWSLLRVGVYGWAEDADRIAVTHMAELDSTADTSDPVINLWSDANTTARTGSDTDDIVEWTVAKFDFPTVISAIYLTSGDKAGRNRGIAYEGSMDGEHWTQILRSGHQNDSQYNNGTKRVEISDENAWLYLRARNVLESETGDWHWNVINFAVYGTTPTVTAQGTQAKIKGDGTYAVRMVSTLDLLDYDAVGFEITVTGEGLAEAKEWDKKTSYVYTAISEGVYDEQSGTVVQTVRDAAYFGANYICALTVDNISIEAYGALTFTVRAYIELDGARLYADTFSATYNDGVYIAE